MFLNLVMLAALGGMAAPLVVHLLSRARYRNVQWGAMMFLDGPDARQSHIARLKQYLLLALRMLIVGLLAAALARPVVRGRWGGLAQEGRITAVIILDRSYSMACEEAGRSRFDKARDAALQVIAQMRRGDEVALVLLGEELEVRPPTPNLQLLARDVSDLQVSAGAADISQGLERAREILDSPSRPSGELYLISDRQATSWKDIAFTSPYARWLASPDCRTRFYFIPVGSDDTDNVAVESVALTEAVAVRQQPAEVEVRVRNYSSRPRVKLELTLSVMQPNSAERRRVKMLPVTLPAAGATSLRVPLTFDHSGSHVITAEIQAPGLEIDNRFDTAIDVIDPIDVLIVTGNETGPELRRESWFPRLALSPYQTVHRRPGDPATLTVKALADWPSIDLYKHQVIILANLPQISPDQARALEQRVYEGAGLVIAPGNLSRLDNYNNVLYRDAQGLMPAILSAPVAADGSDATSILSLEQHPIFRFRRAADPLPSAVIGRYFPATPRPTDSRILGSYASGQPFVVEGPRGRGRVLLLTTPLSADWSTLPLSPFYLPFVQSMVRYLGAGVPPSRNLSTGQPLLASFDEPAASAELFRGDQRLDVSLLSGGTQVQYTDTQRPGIYRLRLNSPVPGLPPRMLHFVVQTPRQESDLTPLTDAQLSRLRHALRFTRLSSHGESIAATVAEDRGGRELWLTLLVIAIVLGVGELWLARAWAAEAA